MTDVQQAAPAPVPTLPDGDVVFVPQHNQFGRIMCHFDNPNCGLLYQVKMHAPGHSFASAIVLPAAIWHLPALNAVPPCRLAPYGSRA